MLQVQDVLGPQRITRIPLAPPEVAGSLNLRGRIVTAIDIRIAPRAARARPRASRHERRRRSRRRALQPAGRQRRRGAEPRRAATLERNPATLDPRWREVSAGIYRLDEQLLVVLDVPSVLDFAARASAA